MRKKGTGTQYIYRRERDGRKDWLVSIKRKAKTITERFHDTSYGGKDKALKEALKFRDKVLESTEPFTYEEYCDFLRSNNTSGKTGVYFKKQVNKKTGYVFEQWEAYWPNAEGKRKTKGKTKRKTKGFSIIKYGYDEAYILACDYRDKMIKQYNHKFIPGAKPKGKK